MQQNPRTVPTETLPLQKVLHLKILGVRGASTCPRPGPVLCPGLPTSPSWRVPSSLCLHVLKSVPTSKHATSKPSLISASPLVTSFSPLCKQNFSKESTVYTYYRHSLTSCSRLSPTAAWPLLLLVRSSPRLPKTHQVQGHVPSCGLSSIHTVDLAFLQKSFLPLTSVVLISFLPL